MDCLIYPQIQKRLFHSDAVVVVCKTSASADPCPQISSSHTGARNLHKQAPFMRIALRYEHNKKVVCRAQEQGRDSSVHSKDLPATQKLNAAEEYPDTHKKQAVKLDEKKPPKALNSSNGLHAEETRKWEFVRLGDRKPQGLQKRSRSDQGWLTTGLAAESSSSGDEEGELEEGPRNRKGKGRRSSNGGEFTRVQVEEEASSPGGQEEEGGGESANVGDQGSGDGGGKAVVETGGGADGSIEGDSAEAADDVRKKAEKKLAEKEAGKRSLEAILTGLERSPTDRQVTTKVQIDTNESGTAARGGQRAQIATASRLGQLSDTELESSDSVRTVKWEESPVDFSGTGKTASFTPQSGFLAFSEPQEFARELVELDGFPINFGGGGWETGTPAQRKARSLSAHKVRQTLALLEGVSASQDRKVRKYYREGGGDGETVSDGKPALGDKELGELLTPLVGRLSTLEFNKVLKAVGERGNWKMAVGVLKWMEGQPQCPPDEWSYSTVLAVLGKQKRSTVAVSVFERMEWRGFNPNQYVYSAMISCYASVREYKDAVRTFGKMVASGIEPNVVTWSALIDACAKGGAGIGTCLKLFERMEASSQKQLDEQVYNILGDAYAKLGDWESVRTVIRTMEEKGVRPSVVTVNTLLHAMTIGDALLQSVMGVYNTFLRAGGRPSGFTYSILVKACGLRGDLVALDWVWAEMHSNPDWVYSSDKDRVRVYNTVLGVYSERGLVSDALRVFQEIKRQGFEPDRVSYNLLISALGLSGQLAEAEKVLTVMRREGWPPNVYSYIALMEAYLKGGQLMKVEETFRRIETAGLEPTVSAFNLLMQAYVSRGNPKQAASLLTEMRKRGRHPNATSYAILICAHGSSATSASVQSAKAGDAYLAPFRIVELFNEMKEREAAGLFPREARDDVIRAFCLCGRLGEAVEQLRELVLLWGGGADVASLAGGAVSACVEGGDVQRLPAAVEVAVEGGWDLEPQQVLSLLNMLTGVSVDGLVEKVLGALGGGKEGGLGRAVYDALLKEKKDGLGDGGAIERVERKEAEGTDGETESEGEEEEEGGSMQEGNGTPNGVGKDDVSSSVTGSTSEGVESDRGGSANGGRPFGFELQSSLPSTAELETIFDGLGLGYDSAQRSPSSKAVLPSARFRKRPAEVYWPQRALPLGGRAEKLEKTRVGSQDVTRENGVRRAEEGSGEEENVSDPGKVQEQDERRVRRDANLRQEPRGMSENQGLSEVDLLDQRFGGLLERLEAQLSEEDLGSVSQALVGLASRLDNMSTGQTLL